MDDFSSFKENGTVSIPPGILQILLDAMPQQINVLRPIRKAETIIDFEHILSNEAATTYASTHAQIAKKLHERSKGNIIELAHLFDDENSGKPFASIISMDIAGTPYWYREKYLRLGEQIIVIREDVMQQQLTEPIAEAVERLAPGVRKVDAVAQSDNFKRIIDNSHNALITLDLEGKITYWNPAAESLFGYPQDEVMGKRLTQFIVPEGKQGNLNEALLSVHLQGKSIIDSITQKQNRNGQILDILANIFALKDDQGNITGSCLSMKDITAQKKAERNSQENIHLISQIMDTTPDIIYIMDLTTRHFLYSNRQLAADLGYTKAEIIDMKNPIIDLMYEEDIPAMLMHLKKMQTITSDDEVVEIEYRIKNSKGGLTWFCDRNSVFKRNASGTPVEKIGICQDITVRKKQEQQTQTSQDIIYQSEQVVAMGNWQYDILKDDFSWSEGMYRLFGMEGTEQVRPDVYLDYAPEKEQATAQKIFDHILHEFAPFEEILTIATPEGDKKIVKIKSVVQKDKEGKAVKVIGVDLDITQHVKTSEEINHLNSILMRKNSELQILDKEIRNFNIVAAHDYKETLQQLYTNLEYIVSKDARNLSDAGKANIRRAQSAIQKMNLLTDDINAYFQLYEQEVEIKTIDPNPVIKNLIAAYQRKLEQHNATVEYAEWPDIPSDPVLLQKLLGNLIDHAIKFRNMMTPLVVKLRYSKSDEMNVLGAARQDLAYGIISVSDNGIGFSEADAETLFDLFNRPGDKAKTQASGVGLAMCKKIMSMHDGFITAEGHPAKGSTFNCYFPLRG